jgi:hypothetical protein
VLPLYTFLACFLLKEGGEGRRERVRINRLTFCVFLEKKGERERKRERKRENKQTYLLCFLKKEKSERGGKGGRERRRGTAQH